MAKTTRQLLVLVLAALLPACGLRDRDDGTNPSPSDEPHCGPHPHRVTTLKPQGGRVDWSAPNGRIAYDRAGADGFFDVWVMNADGGGDTCLTCDRGGLPQRHNGNPVWHPSGNWIVFQSEVASSRNAFAGNPGRGVNNVLWITDPTGRSFFPLTELSRTDEASGVLHPHFSRDGGRLAWSEMYEPAGVLEPGMFFGHWRLVIADFAVGGDGRPVVRNLRRFERDQGFYENHGFSPDGSQLLFSSNLAQGGVLQAVNNDIFTVNLGSLALTRLTSSGYNEHAGFFPSGRKVVWMSNADNPSRGTDLWIMNPDGTSKERLTYMNQSGCPEYAGSRAVAADNSVNAAGDKILVYVQDELFGDVGSIKLVELSRPF
jgi:Tol biopolymer transport system component